MDKKYTLIGILLLAGAFAFLYLQPRPVPEPPQEDWEHREESVLPDQRSDGLAQQADSPLYSDDLFGPPAPGVYSSGDTGGAVAAPSQSQQGVAVDSSNGEAIEEIYVLENDLIRVEFTNFGGAIRQVALKAYAAVQGEPAPYIFNEGSELPALGISFVDRGAAQIEQYAPPYRQAYLDDRQIVFSLEHPSGVEILRSYEISQATEGPDPYVIRHGTRFINRTDAGVPINHIFVNVGTAPPTASDPSNYMLNFGYYDGDKYDTVKSTEFKAGGFLGFFEREPKTEIQKNTPNLVWAAAKNQFFTSIVTPEVPGVGVFVSPTDHPALARGEKVPQGITGSMQFELPNVSPQAERTLNLDLYVGPKELSRLNLLGQKQELVMQLGFFGKFEFGSFLGKLLLWLLIALHDKVKNYGLAIIIMTVFIRLLLWPLTAKAAKSSKQMAKIQEPMKALREKYKDSPEKLQKETVALFKEYKVNPAAGCLPIVVQIPIFFALFQMLRSASELRFANFLWIRDLSLADTVATVGGFPINPLPLVMGVTMHFQMKMTPTTLDSTQQKIFKMLPFIFLVFCYSFSSGLVLYWTMSNCFSILQQYLTNRRKDPDEPTPVVVAPGRTKRKTIKKLRKPSKK